MIIDYNELMAGGTDELIANKKLLYHDIIRKGGCNSSEHLAVFFSKLYLEGMHAFSRGLSELEKVEWLRDLVSNGFLTDAMNGVQQMPLRDVENPSAYSKMLHAISPQDFPYIYDSHIRTAMGFNSDTPKAREAFDKLNLETRDKVRDLSEREIYLKETNSWRDYKLYM